MTRPAREPKAVEGWAWIIRRYFDEGPWDLGYWLRPTRRELLAEGRPSPEARAIRVSIVPVKRRPRAGGKRKR